MHFVKENGLIPDVSDLATSSGRSAECLQAPPSLFVSEVTPDFSAVAAMLLL